MSIVRAQVLPHRGRLRRTLANARGRWAERSGLLLRLWDEDGRLGQGEASPLPGYSPDTLGEARRALERMEWGGVSWTTLPPLPPSARFAAETALLDLAGQRAGRPLHTLLGEGGTWHPVPVATLLDADVLSQARGAHRRGVRIFKLKLGGPARLNRDAQLGETLRDALGPDVGLRFDGNRAYAPAQARRLLERLAPLRPEFVEEPSEPDGWGALSRIGVPLAADESVQRDESLSRALASPICRTVVLKPMVLGGFAQCLALAKLARSRGARVVVSHLWDGPIALAACAALALAVPGASAAGLDRHGGLAAWPRVRTPFLEGGYLVPTALVGLGLAEVSPR